MEIERMALLMAHVLSVVGAAIGIAFADLSLFKGGQVDTGLLRTACRVVAWALGGLWLTGLLIVWIDTGFDLGQIASRPKLVAKLLVVIVLSINGFLLHHHFFALVVRPRRLPPARLRSAVNATLAMTAVSGASWLYAGFLGLARPLAPIMGFPGFASAFALLLLLSLLIGTRLVRPRLWQIYLNQPRM